MTTKRRSNRAAVDATIESLEQAGRLAPEDDALVTLCRRLAVAVDEHPENAALWRELRMGITALSQLGADNEADNEAAAFQAELSAAMNGIQPGRPQVH